MGGSFKMNKKVEVLKAEVDYLKTWLEVMLGGLIATIIAEWSNISNTQIINSIRILMGGFFVASILFLWVYNDRHNKLIKAIKKSAD